MMILGRQAILWTPGLGENNILSDCAVVALVNAMRAACLVQKGFDPVINWDRVVVWFARIAGVDPNLPAEETVQGLDPANVIRYAMVHGIDIGAIAPVMLKNAMRLNLASPAAILDAMRRAAAYVELGLSDADMQSAAAMDQLVGAITKRHMVFFWDCDGLAPIDDVQFGTWGRWQYITWRGVKARIQQGWDLEWILP